MHLGDSSTSCKGGSRPEIEHCCTSTNPCKLNEGDCDDDTQCDGDLVCGTNNCGNSFSWISADCCVKKEGTYFAIYKPATCNNLPFDTIIYCHFSTFST